ncbi:hypothetical protein LDENG_00242970 [Lucifuga dentata]|nr:hypothetical protein LDENG_00242970 [Lucifuga dentata]
MKSSTGLVPRAGAPSWVAQLEDEDPEHGALEDQQQTVRDLTLKFVQYISSMAADRKQNITFSDNRMESLIQKADQVLNSLHKSFRGEAEGLQDPPAGPPDPASRPAVGGERCSVDDSSNHVTPDSASPAGGVAKSPTQQAPPYSDRKQPGPVEALKQMLFRLQHVEAELHRRRQQQAAARLPHAQTPFKQQAEGEAELESLTGASLQRALHHLSRLKLLVEEPRDKEREEEEDEDEGR